MATTVRKEPPVSSGPESDPEPPAVASIGGANPFVGLSRAQVVSAVARWARQLLQHPMVLAAWGAEIMAEDLRILAGVSTVEPDKKDRRFSDEVWQGPVWHRVEQAYLSRRSTLLRSVDELDLDHKSAARAKFGLMQVSEALAPTNNLVTNPVALRKARQTGGRSVVKGMRQFAWDAKNNDGLPSQVDSRAFELGRNIAVTPGAVVERAPQYELLQYVPTTERVHRRPVVIISPQINKYYFLDIAPGRSFVEHTVAQGFSTFMMSWRSATPEDRHWSADTYVTAVRRALETACEITGSEDALAIGFCAGGMTLAMLASHLAAVDDPLLAGITMAVSMMDTQSKSSLNAFLTDRSATASISRARRKGVLEGTELAKVFAWVRPNDLVWNYWVSNYLMGETPPAFDVLAWNADPTDLPAALYEDFVRMMMDNALMKSGARKVLGTPLDLSTVTTDMYLVGASSDHLVPWQSVYAATQVHGGRARFALSDSGHIQALINPPTNPKSGYFVGDSHPPSPEAFVATAERRQGSWWTDWAAWAAERGGGEVAAPVGLGSDVHPVLCSAPGAYVHGGSKGQGMPADLVIDAKGVKSARGRPKAGAAAHDGVSANGVALVNGRAPANGSAPVTGTEPVNGSQPVNGSAPSPTKPRTRSTSVTPRRPRSAPTAPTAPVAPPTPDGRTRNGNRTSTGQGATTPPAR